ncbi:plasmid mobilization relaxosome protein MobC [Bacteroides sp. An51A]|uniref:plasmid mobilization protein n=1 Tax=Bacteroides sp. An51A TaxID=1965640 RepID=UPI000B36A70C|nr:plasmid mobilization relaxosome protein MobC [Bacteroides sp. An51A]OUN77860.1 plasmid mobilization relaxosome protein MobC [Bacteroides sp. An51A]
MKENKTKNIVIRLTEEEKNKLVKQAGSVGKSLSSYIREVSLKGNITSKTDIQTVYELKKIGANINQLVKHANMLPVDENVRQLLARMNEYLSDIDRIKKNLL